jgi:hypothetical protein
MVAFQCSALAHELDVQQIGSAPTVRYWFLIEYARAWGAQAVEDFWRVEFASVDHTPLSAYPQSRWLLIKRSEKPTSQVRFFVVDADEKQPCLYEFTLNSYADLLTLDLTGVFNGAYEMYRRESPLFVTCTNGRRDPCCAKFGAVLYPHLARIAGESAWQCSHIGGHRFAATGVCFPHAIYYGGLAPEEASTLVRMYREGEIYFERSRGRASYSREAQVAEQFLREQTGERRLNAFTLDQVHQEGQHWHIQFSGRDGKTHHIHFLQAESAWETYTSCDAEQPKRDLTYTLLDYQVSL